MNENKYEEEIKPLVERLAVLCHDYNIPMFLTMAISNDKNGTQYKSKIIDSDFIGISLTDDKFKDLLNVMNGFKTYYPKDEDLDEFMY